MDPPGLSCPTTDMPLWYQCPSVNDEPVLLPLAFPLCQGQVVLRPTVTFPVSSKHCYKSPLTVLCFLILPSVLEVFHSGTNNLLPLSPPVELQAQCSKSPGVPLSPSFSCLCVSVQVPNGRPVNQV